VRNVSSSSTKALQPSPSPSALRTAGFTVQRFPEWFCDEDGTVKRNVEDPEVIRFCHRNGWLLVTRDHEMKNTHREEIKKTEVAILSTAHNSSETKTNGS
jgi:hypothetical protein